jgi:pimeloyl-ACP methyl ester carboxylesterase
VDVSAAVGADATLAMTIFADPSFAGPRVVALALPGGGYARAYFDLRLPALSGQGQAEYHASNGWMFISIDPIATGDSVVAAGVAPDLDETARIHSEGMRLILDALRAGTLVAELGPIEIAKTVGVGHSLGGMQLIAQQGLYGTFDVLAVLAFSAIHTVIPSEDGLIETSNVDALSSDRRVDEAWGGPLVEEPHHFEYAFFWDDISPELVEADLGVGFPVRTAAVLPPWVSATFPVFAAVGMSRGVVRRHAALITSPVLIVAAERDVIADLRAEPAAYPVSRDITVYELPACAHMHNFSNQRFLLWQRLHAWVDGAVRSAQR